MVGVLQSYDPMDPVLIRREDLLPRSGSRSGTGSSIVTVAALSHGLLEAPSQNQNSLGCPQLTDITNGSDNEISQPTFQENAAQSSDISRSISISQTADGLSNDAAIPPPTVSSHNVLPDPGRPQGSSMGSSQSFSRMDTSVLSPIEPTNQRSSCVIRRLVTDLPTDYPYPYNRMPQTVSSSTATQSISNFSLLSIHESRTSEGTEDVELDSRNEDSRPVGDVENASSMTATTNTRIARHNTHIARRNTHNAHRFSIGSSSSRGISGSNTTGSGAGIGTGSLSVVPLLQLSPFYVTLST